MSVEEVCDINKFHELIKNNSKVAVDCFATWCGPCRFISPKFEEFAKQFTGIKFIKVDVDKSEQICNELGINCMPTFFFYRNQQKMTTFSGADEDKLKESLQKL